MVDYKTQKERQFDLNKRFDIVITLLESSHNPKYKIDMLRRVKQLKWDVSGEFDKYDNNLAKIQTRNKINKELGENLD